MTVDPAAILDGLPEMLSPNRAARSEPINLVIIHTMETSRETAGAARASCAWHQSGQTIGSAHVHIDASEAVRGVPDAERANHAAGVNSRSVGIELAGKAGQTPDEWADATSAAILERAAQVTAAYCVRYGIPPVKIGPADIRSGKAGCAGHVDASDAYQMSSHWDPGPSFPWASFMERVQELTGVDMPLTINELAMIRREAKAGASEALQEAFADGKAGKPDGYARRAVTESVKRMLLTLLKPVLLRRKQ